MQHEAFPIPKPSNSYNVEDNDDETAENMTVATPETAEYYKFPLSLSKEPK
jgi:hypothetical protein